jgi:2-aminoethylphosphonate transport system substrate-binding protein
MNLYRPVLALLVVIGMLIPGCSGRSPSGSGTESLSVSPDSAKLTVYSASGLGDWFAKRFDDFTAETGIEVAVVEGGSGEMVSRVDSERSDPQADLLVVLPPFIQKAAKSGLLQPSGVDAAGITSQLVGPGAIYVPIVNNALSFIASPDADPQPQTWEDLLESEFRGKLQYSTPGEAGDGTAMLLLLQKLMGKPGALDYLSKLEANNVGPSGSTGKLQAKVDSGELLVANGDIQMNLASINNDGSKFDIFFPAMPDGSRTTIAVPYVAGVTAGSRRPAEAKKLLAFLLSETVQKSVESEAFGIPVLNTVDRGRGDAGDMTPAGLLNGVEVWEPNWTAVLGDLDYDIASYQKAIGG